MKAKKAVCIAASNKAEGRERERSGEICRVLSGALAEQKISCQVLELRDAEFLPCTGCGGCREERKCISDQDFNRIYGEIEEADYLFFISPHTAPIPPKLCMLLEKMMQNMAAEEGKNSCACGKNPGKLAALISYAGELDQSGTDQKPLINDVIADILKRMDLRVVPFNSRWDTGIFLSDSDMIRTYVEIVIQTSKTLYAIL